VSGTGVWCPVEARGAQSQVNQRVGGESAALSVAFLPLFQCYSLASIRSPDANSGLWMFRFRRALSSIVEVSPPYDVAEITALAAATVVWEYLALIGANPSRHRPPDS
jgi:Arginase family